MIQLLLPWTLLTTSLWRSGSSQILQQETIGVLYPQILSKEVLTCDCAQIPCDSVYWFRSNSNQSKFQYVGKVNNAGRSTYGHWVDKARFKLNRPSSSSFTLHINAVTKEDAGIYSCVIMDRKNTEIWKPGILLDPGGIPPTSTPTTKPIPATSSVCHCSKEHSSHDGCGALVLWPLVGISAGLALALIGSLYYFSRLPKKCRHHVVKKR